MTNQPEGFYKQVPDIGDFYLRPLRDSDIPQVHDWVNRDYARFWGQQGSTPEQVAAFYRDLAASGHARAYMGLHNARPAFLMESYEPAHEPIGAHYDVQPGDHGMHVLVAPAERPIHGFTWHVFTTIMDFLFSQPAIRRIVVEPDIRNEKIHRLNRRAGFVYDKVVELPEKTACLAFCTRAQYRAAMAAEGA